MMKSIIDKIGQYGFADFKITEVRSSEKQFYLLKDRIESKRNVESHYYDITVYTDHIQQKKRLRGEYNFIYKPSADLKFYLAQAEVACSMIKNRHYELAKSIDAADVQVLDTRLENAEAVGTQLADTIYQHTRDTNVHLSSAEIYLKKSDIILKTSTGIEVSKTKGLIEVDVTLIGRKGNDEQEMNFHLLRRNIDDLRLPRRIEEYKEHVLNTLAVEIPNSGKADVVISAVDIYGLFNPLIFHSSGQAQDQGISRFRLGQRIIDCARNDLTVKSSGILPFGLHTDPFDDDGISGQEHTIIDHGVFKKHWTTKRYADYLRVVPTGSFKNLIIEPAVKSIFESDSYHEIVQFSDLSPDPLTGDLVAEIRFGYHVQNGRKTPIKGGSVACNIFKALENAYFSNDSTFEGNYSGPKFIALKDLSISGQ
jgi:predicted Zn-dependent protease